MRELESITEEELVERDIIWWPEIRWLMNHFDVDIKVLAEICGLKESTMNNYNANSQLPKAHHFPIIHFFLGQFNDEFENSNPTNPKAEVIEERSINRGGEENSSHINQNLNYLDFDKIVFSVRGSIEPALREAGEYSAEAGIPVHVKVGDKIWKVSVEE